MIKEKQQNPKKTTQKNNLNEKPIKNIDTICPCSNGN